MYNRTEWNIQVRANAEPLRPSVRRQLEDAISEMYADMARRALLIPGIDTVLSVRVVPNHFGPTENLFDIRIVMDNLKAEP
jgi:hypothetical protein